MPHADPRPRDAARAAARFRKSRRSDSSSSCVEVADLTAGSGLVLVRDSKDAAGPVLAFAGPQWAAFTAALRAGRFDG